MPRIVSVSAYPVQLPLKEPFTTAKGRKTHSPTVIIKIILDSGLFGLGEATPVQYVTGETIESVENSIIMATSALTDADPADWRALSLLLEEALPDSASARAGLEMALLDAASRVEDVPLHVFLGGRKSLVVTDTTIPIVSPPHAAELAAAAWDQGVRHLKMKANGTPDDIRRILAVAGAAPEAEIKIDANQAFSPAGAVAFIHVLERAGVHPALFEQPVASDDVAGLKYVSDNAPVPVYADESAVTPADVIRLVEARAVSGVNIKLMKSGPRGALEIVDICRQAGLSLMIGCMLESRIGLSAALRIACAAQAFDHFDLDSDVLVADQPVTGGFTRTGDTLEVDDQPGLGCEFTLRSTD
jgi:L-Ala-D/L-Glu epimerase